jgi:hypothetical protein
MVYVLPNDVRLSFKISLDLLKKDFIVLSNTSDIQKVFIQAKGEYDRLFKITLWGILNPANWIDNLLCTLKLKRESNSPTKKYIDNIGRFIISVITVGAAIVTILEYFGIASSELKELIFK